MTDFLCDASQQHQNRWWEFGLNARLKISEGREGTQRKAGDVLYINFCDPATRKLISDDSCSEEKGHVLWRWLTCFKEVIRGPNIFSSLIRTVVLGPITGMCRGCGGRSQTDCLTLKTASFLASLHKSSLRRSLCEKASPPVVDFVVAAARFVGWARRWPLERRASRSHSVAGTDVHLIPRSHAGWSSVAIPIFWVESSLLIVCVGSLIGGLEGWWVEVWFGAMAPYSQTWARSPSWGLGISSLCFLSNFCFLCLCIVDLPFSFLCSLVFLRVLLFASFCYWCMNNRRDKDFVGFDSQRVLFLGNPFQFASKFVNRL